MRQRSLQQIANLLADHEPPCISLYQPTHRRHPENQQDPIRYRNLLRTMEASLREKYPTRAVEPLMERFHELSRDFHFWNHRTDGLAVLGSVDAFHVFDVQRPVKELLVVADSFHLKPLLRVFQSADRFQVLCLNRQEAKLFEGNRHALDAVELTEFPSTITTALGEQVTEPYQSVRSLGAHTSIHHGSGQKKDEVAVDVERFFRVVDRGILDHHSRPSGLPLLLAALPEHHAPFRAVSHNPFLLSEGLAINPDSLSIEELRVESWRKIEPAYHQRLAKLVEEFTTARSHHNGTDDLSDAARAAVEGRIAALLVEADRVIPGKLDPRSGQITPGELSHPEVGDLLDIVAETVLRMKGEVVVVPADRMPTKTGIAARFRY